MERDIYWEVSEFIRDNLVYTYHINHAKLISCTFPTELEHSHEHSFEEVLKIYLLEPEAIYLTDEDMKCYSGQELRILEKLQKSVKEIYKFYSDIKRLKDTDRRLEAILDKIEDIEENDRLRKEYEGDSYGQ